MGRSINYCTVRQLLQGLNVYVGDIGSVLLDGHVHFSHWTNACGHITSASIAMCFYRGAAIVCKRGQQAIDLFIPVLLNSETNWWKKDGGLPIYATDTDDETSDSDYFLPASWTVDQTKFVLDNFSGILIQVKNRKGPRRGDVKKCHDKIQRMANQIFETGSMNKPCVSLYMQLGGKRLFEGMDQVEMCSDTLRVSLIVPEQYGYYNPEREGLKLLVKYSYDDIIDGLFANDDNARPFDEIDSVFF
jgi:hypothetical protein